MNKYVQGTGRFEDAAGNLVGFGEAGQGAGRNNPDMQNVHNIGPLPCGFYKILEPYHHPKLGVLTFNLEPFPENEMFGRADFRIHGYAAVEPSSEGCICQHKDARLRIEQIRLQDDLLEVVR